MAKIANWKKKKVEEVKNLLTKYNVIGLADLTNLPSAQLQKMRSSLKDTVLITMTKGRLIRRAIEQLKDSKKNIEELNNIMTGMPALLLTNTDAFKLSKSLSKSKTKAPAKPGQKAPNDITIPAGPTPFAPGPVMGELGSLGIKTMIQDGKIVVKEDKLLVKDGEIINEKISSLLLKLKIEPMEIGINLLAAYENGLIYRKDVLSIDEKQYINNLIKSYQDALNLSIYIAFPTKDNIKQLIQKAHREGEALSHLKGLEKEESPKEEPKEEEKEKPFTETKEPEPTPEEPKEEKKEEPKPEPEPEEKKKEPTPETKEEKTEEEKKKEEFKKLEKEAKNILDKMQEERMKNPVKVEVEEPKINKGPKIEDLVPKDHDQEE